MKISDEVMQRMNLIALRHKKIIDDTIRVERGLKRIIVEEEPEEVNVPAQPRERQLDIHDHQQLLQLDLEENVVNPLVEGE